MHGTKLKVTGIPFAEPPLGDLRLTPPVLKTQLNVSTFDASNFGPGCLQAVSRIMRSQAFLPTASLNVLRFLRRWFQRTV